jgi:hypothetical protein
VAPRAARAFGRALIFKIVQQPHRIGSSFNNYNCEESYDDHAFAA